MPRSNPRMLRGSQYLGAEHKHMFGPEDLVYDPETGIIYTGCDDGWIKRVGVLNGSVENWVNTGGRPLGLVYAHHQHLGQGLIVADAVKVGFLFFFLNRPNYNYYIVVVKVDFGLS